MKITKQHRECFKEALEYLGSFTDYCCNAIDFTSSCAQIQEDCKRILFHYFQDNPSRTVLWLSYSDEIENNDVLTCRLLALYTLIYAPL